MTAQRNAMGTLLVNLGAFAAFLLLMFVTVRVSDGLAGREAVVMLATAAATALAVWLRARVVALLLAAMLAFNLAELLAHSIWGQRAVQGGPTHFTVLGAAALGVLLTLAVQRYLGSRTE